MSTPNEAPAPRRPKRRWRRRLALALLSLPMSLLALFAALPWIAGSPWMKPRLEAAANRILAPGGVSFDRVRLSWFRPTRIDAPALLDANGRKLVAAPTGTFSWTFWQMLFARPVVGELRLHKGAVEIGRSIDGDVDLIETLKPILLEKPDHTVLVRIEDATLKFTQQGVADPFYADHADIAIDLTRHPEPISWDLKLARDDEPSGPGKITIAGSLGRVEEGVDPMKNAALAVTGDRWPWRITPTEGDLVGFKVSGVYPGELDLKVVEGALTTTGAATIEDLLIAGDRLSGDEVRQDKVRIDWKAEGEGGVYHVDRFAFEAPAATLAAAGEFPPVADQPAKVVGRVDLAALASQLRRTLRLQDDLVIEKGSVSLTAEAQARPAQADGADGGQRIEATAKLADLAAKNGAKTIVWNDPTTLVVRVDRTPSALSLDELEIITPFFSAAGKGNLDDGINVAARFDLAAARDRLRDWVDLGGFETSGAGTINARYVRKDGHYQVSAEGQVKELVLAGLPVVETVKRDEFRGRLAVRGEAHSSGLPRDWRHASLQAESAEDELKLETTSEADVPTPSNVKAFGRTTVDFGGSKRVMEASGDVAIGEDAIDAADLRVAASRFVGPGGAFIPEDAYVWRGAARYEFPADELTLRRHEEVAVAGERPPAFSVDLVKGGAFGKKGAAWFEVDLSGDLAGIQDVLGAEAPSLIGALAAEVDGRQRGDVWELDAVVHGKDMIQIEAAGARHEIGAATLKLSTNLAVKERRLDVSLLALDTPFAKLDGEGSITMPDDAPVVDLKGTFAPDYDRLTRELAARVEPNASIQGRPHDWSLAGRFPLDREKGEALGDLDGEVGLRLDLVDVFGMRLEQTTLVVRSVRGEVLIDPIDAMLNDGRLRLDPAIETDPDGSRWLRLGRGSSLAGAVVNDEVSHRVLSFVAPVLDQATRVEGSVSFDLEDAQFPLDGDSAKTKVEGDVQFDDVRFMPGPLVDQLIAVFNLERKAIFVLRDPVSVRILGRKIYQEGLILPVGEVAVIGIEGWMDFDKRIDMLATFAVVPPRRNIPVVSVLLENAQIHVPLTGTLDNPKIDGDRIKERFKDFGESLLETTLGVGAGIGDIFRRGGGGRGPRPLPAPAPVPRGAPGLDVPRLDGPRLEAPAAEEPDDEDEAVRPTSREVPAPPRPGVRLDGPEVLFPGFRLPFSRTPEERQLQKQVRQQRREERKAERRLRQGRPLD